MLSGHLFGPGGNTTPEDIGSMGGDTGRSEGATAEKAVPFPGAVRRSLVFFVSLRWKGHHALQSNAALVRHTDGAPPGHGRRARASARHARHHVRSPRQRAARPFDAAAGNESKHKTVNPFASMPPASDWSSKAGIDYRKPSFPAADFQPGALTAGSVPDQSNGVAWATVTAPGFQFPLGWDQTSIETRVDPSQQQSKVGTTLSR
jgi:hypothetical protein